MKSRSVAKIDISTVIGIIGLVLAIIGIAVSIAVSHGETDKTVDLAFSDNCTYEEIKVNADKGDLSWKLENTGSTSLKCKVEYKSKKSGSYQQV